MFSNTSGVLITGGVFNQFDGNAYPTLPKSVQGLDILHSKVVPGALHNSGERFDPPKCHPNTRTAILDDLVEWLDQTSDHRPGDETRRNPSSSTWLNGPAGAGKSAIAQSFAQMCYDQGQLSSTFFFSRTSDTGRNDEKRLIATLAYQMSKHIPETQPFVSAAILNDPLIFNLSLETQIDSLLVIPLSRASEFLSEPAPPKVIIMDGLDECLNPDVQRIIVKVFVAALERTQHNLPHKLLIASRSEPHLVSVFSEPKVSSFLKRLTLDATWEPEEDIRLFLIESFADIRKYHPLSGRLSSQWPSESNINKLVRRSSGQFIYASTVIKYVKSDRHHPAERLKVILSLSKDTKDLPYAQLDVLYTHIFSSVEDPSTVLRILRIFLMNSVKPLVFLGDPLKVAQGLLGLPDGLVELDLNNLSAVVSVTQSGRHRNIRFLHASLLDYLMDETRSGEFYVNSEEICVDLTKCCLNFTSNPETHLRGRPRVSQSQIRFAGPAHFAHHIHRRRLEIYQAFSDFDLEAAFSVVPDSGKVSDKTKFLTWTLNEYKHLSSPDDRFILSMFVTRLRNWLFAQLQKFPFDNSAGLDLTIFAMDPLSANGVLNPLADIFQECLEKSRVSIPHKLYGEIGLCWNMMPALSAFFEDAALAEAHTMTPRRYGDAALHCFRHLLREGKPRKWKNDERWSISRSNYLQTMRYATFFLPKAEAQRELHAICKEIVGLGDVTVEAQNVPFYDDQGRLYTEAHSYIEKLFHRFEQKTGGAEHPWRSDIMIGSGFAMSIVVYLCRARGSLSDPMSEPVGHEPAPSESIAQALSHANDNFNPPPRPSNPCHTRNPMGVRPWPRNSTTMRWYSWYEQNVLRWISQDDPSFVE